MKFNKPTSFTVDTESSPTHLFQSQLLNKTNASTLSQDPGKLMRIFSQPKNKQSLFLRTKNQRLQEKLKRMEEKIRDLESNKIYLLKINENYVKVLNQYYCNLNPQKIDLGVQDRKNSIESSTRSQRPQKRQKSCQKEVSDQTISIDSHRLVELQKNHRNLTKHFLAMEGEIKNYSKEMQKFAQIKTELQSVNHTSPKQLIHEIQQVVTENKSLKKQNNRLNFELQKCKAECTKLTKSKQIQKRNIGQNSEQIEKMKAQINKVLQESKDKADKYEQRIYQLELKVAKLEKQLRKDQQKVIKNEERRKSMQVSRVEDVLENNFLRTNLSDLLDHKKHLLLTTNRNIPKDRPNRSHSSLSKNYVNY